MRMLKSGVLPIIALLLAATVARADGAVTTYTTDAPFAQVMADLEDAVVNRGFVVDYHGHIGDMLARTATDVKGAKPLYKAAEILQFCSATVSRKAMEADIGNIAYCPYILFAYEPAVEPGKVTLGFRRLPDGDGRDDVNILLDEIVRDAAGQ